MQPAWLNETQGFAALMALHDARPGKLLGDRGYDSANISDNLTEHGVEPVLCQPPQTVPPHRDPLRKNCQGLSFNARSRKLRIKTVNTT
jgi:hypothetical protein